MRNSRGTLHHVCTLSADHGPGLRYVAFLQGCPLSCTAFVQPQWRSPGGKQVEAAALVRHAARYKPYFGRTGGMTLTGAEPLAQVEFCLEVAKAARQQGISFCLETTAYRFDAQVRALYGKVNLVLLRLRIPEANQGARGRKAMEAMRQTLAYFSAAGIPFWIQWDARDARQQPLPWDPRGLDVLRQEVPAERQNPFVYPDGKG